MSQPLLLFGNSSQVSQASQQRFSVLSSSQYLSPPSSQQSPQASPLWNGPSSPSQSQSRPFDRGALSSADRQSSVFSAPLYEPPSSQISDPGATLPKRRFKFTAPKASNSSSDIIFASQSSVASELTSLGSASQPARVSQRPLAADLGSLDQSRQTLLDESRALVTQASHKMDEVLLELKASLLEMQEFARQSREQQQQRPEAPSVSDALGETLTELKDHFVQALNGMSAELSAKLITETQLEGHMDRFSLRIENHMGGQLSAINTSVATLQFSIENLLRQQLSQVTELYSRLKTSMPPTDSPRRETRARSTTPAEPKEAVAPAKSKKPQAPKKRPEPTKSKQPSDPSDASTSVVESPPRTHQTAPSNKLSKSSTPSLSERSSSTPSASQSRASPPVSPIRAPVVHATPAPQPRKIQDSAEFSSVKTYAKKGKLSAPAPATTKKRSFDSISPDPKPNSESPHSQEDPFFQAESFQQPPPAKKPKLAPEQSKAPAKPPTPKKLRPRASKFRQPASTGDIFKDRGVSTRRSSTGDLWAMSP